MTQSPIGKFIFDWGEKNSCCRVNFITFCLTFQGENCISERKTSVRAHRKWCNCPEPVAAPLHRLFRPIFPVNHQNMAKIFATYTHESSSTSESRSDGHLDLKNVRAFPIFSQSDAIFVFLRSLKLLRLHFNTIISPINHQLQHKHGRFHQKHKINKSFVALTRLHQDIFLSSRHISCSSCQRSSWTCHLFAAQVVCDVDYQNASWNRQMVCVDCIYVAKTMCTVRPETPSNI